MPKRIRNALHVIKEVIIYTNQVNERRICVHNWGFVAWIAFLGALVVWSFLSSRKRARSMVDLADLLGLKMWGDRLPPEPSLTGTPISGASATSSVMEGKQNGIPVIAFDCRMGTGKGSWRRTVIAARSSRDVFATVLSESSYTVDRTGEWIILYAPKRGFAVGGSLMPIPELEARLSTLGKDD